MVLSLVGKGAMGEVYAAYDPELDRKVAIKLLRGKSADDAEAAEGRMRMMREAQAIAKLSHPNVVVVHDVGAFEDKIFVAMEFVEGHTLSYWRHAQPRSWTDILKIFADAGRGLAAAHEKDLVHRDFKPDNVMISVDGQVRVMDFGLARTVGRERDAGAPIAAAAPISIRAIPIADESVDLESTRAIGAALTQTPRPLKESPEPLSLDLTRTGAILGTPAYMAPEQFLGQATDARTDQFSFCVALYEGLYGERPFAGNSLQQVEANVLAGEVVAAPAKNDVPSWVRNVMLRGLRPKADDRWPSMKALLAELDKNRLFEGRQVFAEGAAEKLRDIWQVAPAGKSDGSEGETSARVEMRRAFLATGKTYAATTFENVTRMLDRYAQSWKDMYIDICEATHVRGEQSADVLDMRMASLMDLRERFRALIRIFRQADADVVENAIGATNALGSVERCADVAFLRSSVKPPEDQATRMAVESLRAKLADLRILGQVGRVKDGLQGLAQIESDIRKAAYVPLIAEMLLESGILLNEQRDAQAASRILEDAIWAAELSRHEVVAAEAAVLLMFVTGDTQMRFEVAEIWARFAETTLQRMGGHDTLLGWFYNNRGAMRGQQGRMAESLEDLRAAVVAKERAGGADNPDVALSLANLGLAFVRMDRAIEALPVVERSLGIMEKTLGPEHPRAAFVLSNYAELLNELGRFAFAQEIARRALAIFERECGANELLTTYPRAALGVACLGAGDVGGALPALERVVALCDAHESDPARLGEVHFALARALAAAGRERPRAQSLAQRARDEYQRAARIPIVEREQERIDRFIAACASEL